MVTVSFDNEEKYEEKLERVVFYANVDDRKIRCLILRRTLEEHFSILGPAHVRGPDSLTIFARQRLAIHASAQRMIKEMGAGDLDSVTELVLSPSCL